jgi:hypothetical protein
VDGPDLARPPVFCFARPPVQQVHKAHARPDRDFGLPVAVHVRNGGRAQGARREFRGLRRQVQVGRPDDRARAQGQSDDARSKVVANAHARAQFRFHAGRRPGGSLVEVRDGGDELVGAVAVHV